MKRPKVSALPAELHAELDQQIVARGFADYSGLAAWLGERGYTIARASVPRRSSRLEQRLTAIKIATEQGRAIAECSPNEQGAMNDALQRLVQEQLFSLLMKIAESNLDDLGPGELAKIARAAADIGRASIQQQRWMAEARKQVAQKVEHEIGELKRGGGLSDDAETRIRAALLG